MKAIVHLVVVGLIAIFWRLVVGPEIVTTVVCAYAAVAIIVMLVNGDDEDRQEKALYNIRLIADSYSCDLLCEHKSCGILKRISHIAKEASGG